MEEIFLPIIDCEGYEVSNHGRVKSIERVICKSNGKTQTVKERILRLGKGTNGYAFAHCRVINKSYFLYPHRVVALHFLEQTDSKKQVNHKDCNKLNNHIDNLEWCTQRENMQHASANGLCFSNCGEMNGRHKLSNENIKEIISLKKLGYTNQSLGEKFGVSNSRISDIWNGKAWKNITSMLP